MFLRITALTRIMKRYRHSTFSEIPADELAEKGGKLCREARRATILMAERWEEMKMKMEEICNAG